MQKNILIQEYPHIIVTELVNSDSRSSQYHTFPISVDQKHHDFTVIIPAYNEEKRIGPVLSDLTGMILRENLAWNVIVSIDGNDSTGNIVASYARKYDFIQVSTGSGRGGKGAAIKRVLKYVDGDFTILMDADNSVLLSDIMKNISLSKGADVVILSRYLGSNYIPFIRRVISRGFNILLRIFLDINVSDTQSGYKILNTQQLKAAMSKVSVTNTFFDVALLYYMQKAGSNIVETDIKYRHNDGSTFHPLGEVIGQGVSLIAFLIRRSKYYHKIPKSLVDLYYRKFRWI
jgi:glycosyltransferase involved in cell wall biosynthesis